MSRTTYDALIIGGGPGGTAAATYLARSGKRVLILEKEHFPRFHIGESLLPYNHEIFEEMGVLPTLEAAGFTQKFGAQFHLGNSSRGLKLTFQNGCFTRQWKAFQVERATFDHILLKHAQSSGAEVREGWTVIRSGSEPDFAFVEARDEAGTVHRFEGTFLLDASGRSNFTGNQEGLRIVHPRLKKLAIFGHFENVKVDQDRKAGDIIIVRLENTWFWLIPLSPQKVSVGCVMDQQAFASLKLPAAEVFSRIWNSSSELRDRMRTAVAVTPLQTTGDFSYYNRRLIGHRLIRIGDAAGFMDPIFSAGVYLAMHSGKMAAQVVLGSLAAGHDGSRLARVYEKRVFRAMEQYWELVEGFYTRSFMDLFLQPRARFQLPDAIVAVLAGELEGGWKLNWRRRLFFWLVKLQARFPLVPPVSFRERMSPAAPVT